MSERFFALVHRASAWLTRRFDPTPAVVASNVADLQHRRIEHIDRCIEHIEQLQRQLAIVSADAVHAEERAENAEAYAQELKMSLDRITQQCGDETKQVIRRIEDALWDGLGPKVIYRTLDHAVRAVQSERERNEYHYAMWKRTEGKLAVLKRTKRYAREAAVAKKKQDDKSKRMQKRKRTTR